MVTAMMKWMLITKGADGKAPPASNRRKDKDSKSGQTPVKSKFFKPEPGSGQGPLGAKLWDLAGNGGCGLRCLMAQNALRHKKPRADIGSKVQKLARSLRAKAVEFLKSDTEWRKDWLVDPEANSTTEDGEAAQTPDAYLLAAARPAKWIDPWLTEAVCQVFECDVLVWKWLHRGR